MRRFTITEWTGFEITISLDTANPKLEQLMKACIEFWSGAEERMEEAEGDLGKAFALMLAQTVLRESLHYGLAGVIDEIERSEGWPTSLAEYGITLSGLIEFELPTLEQSDLKEVQP